MADPFQVIVPGPVVRRMRSWGLPDALVDEALRVVQADLADAPADKLRPVVTPWGRRLNLYSFALDDPADPVTHHTFMFHFSYAPDETGLVAADCGHVARRQPGGSEEA